MCTNYFIKDPLTKNNYPLDKYVYEAFNTYLVCEHIPFFTKVYTTENNILEIFISSKRINFISYFFKYLYSYGGATPEVIKESYR